MRAATARIHLGHLPIVKFFGLLILPLLVFASSAAAGGPKEQLQGTIDGIISVLKTIHSRADIDKNRNSIHEILQTRFDFEAMAQQSLGPRWNDLNGNQQEFVSVFTDFVEHGYMSTLGSYRGEKVVYDNDRVNGESAEVDTRVIGGEGAPIKIGYKLHLTGGEWMVYDAVIDDVSVIGNYRTQFARILRTASLDQLTQSMRTKASDR
jgi:phospholipid transport system substrate-binding protein